MEEAAEKAKAEVIEAKKKKRSWGPGRHAKGGGSVCDSLVAKLSELLKNKDGQFGATDLIPIGAQVKSIHNSYKHLKDRDLLEGIRAIRDRCTSHMQMFKFVSVYCNAWMEYNLIGKWEDGAQCFTKTFSDASAHDIGDNCLWDKRKHLPYFVVGSKISCFARSCVTGNFGRGQDLA